MTRGPLLYKGHLNLFLSTCWRLGSVHTISLAFPKRNTSLILVEISSVETTKSPYYTTNDIPHVVTILWADVCFLPSTSLLMAVDAQSLHCCGTHFVHTLWCLAWSYLRCRLSNVARVCFVCSHHRRTSYWRQGLDGYWGFRFHHPDCVHFRDLHLRSRVRNIYISIIRISIIFWLRTRWMMCTDCRDLFLEDWCCSATIAYGFVYTEERECLYLLSLIATALIS